MKVIGGAKLISVVYRDIDVEGRAEMWILYIYIYWRVRQTEKRREAMASSF